NTNPQATYDSYHTWAYFKKKNQIPQNVVIALDNNDFIQDNDDRFMKIADLCTTSAGPYGRAGWRHQDSKPTVLFMDGVVRLLKAFNPVGGVGPAPATFNQATTKLEEWMIRCPDLARDNAQTIATQRWVRGRPLPNF